MHTVHHTEAFIVKSIPVGEANLRLWLFTKDFGLVVALVQGVRKSGAKLSMQLSDYSLIEADLVRGREVWRLVSARTIDAPLLAKSTDPLARGFVRALFAIERFCQGEVPEPLLFQHIFDHIQCVKDKNIDASSLDALSLWRIMVHLGYCAVDNAYQIFFLSALSAAARAVDEGKKRYFIGEVNRTISQTHL